MSPFRVPSARRNEIGENGIEQERAESSGSDGAGEGAQFATARSRRVAGGELSAEQAGLGAVPGGGSEGTAPGELRCRLEPGTTGTLPDGGAQRRARHGCG